MFIKSLKISTQNEIIRDMKFYKGMNLIIDNTPTINTKLTGNNVGKTTVLKLIYFCLGGDGTEIYTDEENKKGIYNDVKNFLIDNEILITLTLINDFDEQNSQEFVIERNFLSRRKAIIKINGEEVLKKNFENELLKLIFPNKKIEKPTFKQIISHNIRYKDSSINSTLKTLNSFTTNVEYETLYIFLLGCSFDEGARKQEIILKLQQERTYKDRLEKKYTKNSAEIAKSIVEDDIIELQKKKSFLNLNENFEKDLETLNHIKLKINKSSSNISKLIIRRDIIFEAEKQIKQNISNIDLKQLELIYKEARANVSNLQKTFNELVEYHNKMLVEKIRFITQELPVLEKNIEIEQNNMKFLLEQERKLSLKISKSDSFEDLENIISEINEKFRLKGEYESIIAQFKEVDNNLEFLEMQLREIDNYLYSKDFEEQLKTQLTKFNRYFSNISNELYGEKYALKFEKEINKNTDKPIYSFSAFNLNMSSGKKQGEILCFDLAYTLFAMDEKIPCLNFLLNDKKELMHDNQLLKVADFVKNNNVQLIISILKDKLPEGLIEKSNVVVELAQNDKLFKIENF